jgi:hypothetical protein
MGVVFRAVDTATGREVALKQMLAGARYHRGGELAFRREFHSLVSLKHPRIVEAYDYGVDDHGPFYTMEVLGGRDLRDELELPARDVCLVLRDVAAALAFLHARGLVHRDLAPRNVRRLENGRAKVIDFGILGNVGLSGQIAGTLAYIAPEVFMGLPIDGRTDLYSLGALAYFLVAGRPPREVRATDPTSAFREPPVRPSMLAKELPRALEDLILALLCTDPLGRPATGAEVIDRLTAAGGLSESEDLGVARGYLASAAMVGRRRELRVIRKRILRATMGRGCGVLLLAESGTGKSRLLREAEVEAKLAGCLVARADSETAARGPYGVFEALARDLFVAAPALAKETARAKGSTLVMALPGLANELGQVDAHVASVDPGEDRMRAQRGLLDWLLALSDDKPIALVVDDIQRCDEASCAVFAALLRECSKRRILLLAAVRTGEEVRAKAALDALKSAAKTVPLGGLDAAELKELLTSLFGNVPNLDRLSHLFERATGGSPLFASELARHLVDQGTVRLVGGVWVIPDELPNADIPEGLAAAVDQRLARLPAPARALGQVLALQGGELTLELIAQLARAGSQGVSPGDDAIFEAIDELATSGVVVGNGATYRFRHDGFREGLARGIDDATRRRLHRAIGTALLAQKNLAPDSEIAVGWHLLRGGDERRGAALLLRAGERLFSAQALADCIPPLEAALDVLERTKRSKRTRVSIMTMLLAAGWVANRVVGARYAERTVSAHREACGFDTASRLAPYLGSVLALLIGSLKAWLVWILTGFQRRSPLASVTIFATCLGYACGLAISENRPDDLFVLVKMVEPLGVFPFGIPRAVHSAIHGFPDVILGHINRGARRFTVAIDLIRGDRFTPATRLERAFAEVGVRGLRVLLDVNQFNRRIEEDLEFIDEGPFRYYHLVADAARVVHLRYRGEEAKAQRLERKMETASVQLGSWSTDVQILFFAHPAYALCHDVLGLLRCLEKLEVLVTQGFRVEARVAITRADYLRERGSPGEAIAILRRALGAIRADDLLMRQWGGSSLVEALLLAGELDECIAEASMLLPLGNDPDSGIIFSRLRTTRCLALALAAKGDHAEAIRVIEPAIEEAEFLDCPAVAGGLHEARARIALGASDREGYARHGAEAIRWLRPTGNPSLIALCERLIEAGADAQAVTTKLAAELAVTFVESGTPQGGSGSDSASASGSSQSESDARTVRSGPPLAHDPGETKTAGRKRAP